MRRAVIQPSFIVALKSSDVLKYKGSITLLRFKMSQMVAEYIEAPANQFGGKNREFYGDVNEFLRNDEIFPKFAAKFGSLRVTARHEAVQ